MNVYTSIFLPVLILASFVLRPWTDRRFSRLRELPKIKSRPSPPQIGTKGNFRGTTQISQQHRLSSAQITFCKTDGSTRPWAFFRRLGVLFGLGTYCFAPNSNSLKHPLNPTSLFNATYEILFIKAQRQGVVKFFPFGSERAAAAQKRLLSFRARPSLAAPRRAGGWATLPRVAFLFCMWHTKRSKEAHGKLDWGEDENEKNFPVVIV